MQYLSEIRLFAGSHAPANWARCKGQLLPIKQYEALFSLIGNRYGGDGVQNFALPDLRESEPKQSGISAHYCICVIGS